MHLFELSKLTVLTVATVQCNHMYSVTSGTDSPFSGAYSVLSGIYGSPSIPDGAYSVIGMYGVHTGRYGEWFHV